MKIPIITLVASIILLIPAQALAQEFASDNPYGLNNCNYDSYFVTPDERCFDFFSLGTNNSQQQPTLQSTENDLETIFFHALKKINVTITQRTCTKSTTLAYYSPSKNEIVFCKNNLNLTNKKLYLQTLTHESWHVVQDCVTGLENNTMQPISNSNPNLLKKMVASLNRSDIEDLNLYDSGDLPYEIEAFAMEKRPELVLDGLKKCFNSTLF